MAWSKRGEALPLERVLRAAVHVQELLARARLRQAAALLEQQGRHEEAQRVLAGLAAPREATS